MQYSNHPETLTASDYIGIVLEKTKNNRSLTLTIFKKLFDELPRQLASIENEMEVGHYDEAKEITHKMHGSVSFCGLLSIQEMAVKLEQCLMHKNYHGITPHLRLLKERVLMFTRHQESILAELNRLGS
ncbi:MAG: Hpt domain-containing protein [Gammaproteobacteria bacterium]